jgi:hypothetical protein
LNDVELAYRLSSEQLGHFDQVDNILSFKDTVSNIIWQLGHFPDNSEIDPTFLMNYIVANAKSQRIQTYAIQCMRDLATSRIAAHAVLAKFVFECKYGE